MKPKVGGMYRVVYDKCNLSQVMPIHVTDGSIVIIEELPKFTVFARLVMGEMTSSVWSSDESFPIHPSVLEEIE